MPATAKTCPAPRRYFMPMDLRGEPLTLAACPSRRTFLKRSASVLLVSGVSSSLLSACGGGNLDDERGETPRLASVDNFRDVAGAAAGYPTVDGKKMRRGAFQDSGWISRAGRNVRSKPFSNG